MSDISTDASPATPLAKTVAQLSALFSNLEFRPDLPETDGWWRVADLADAALLAGWYGEVRRHYSDHRVAGTYMANWLLRVLTGIWTLPVVATGRLPLAGLEDAEARRNPGGWFDGAAVAGEVGALPGDPALALPGTLPFADRGALLDALAARLSELAPVIAALRAACPVGLHALWGIVADSVANQSLQVARMTGVDQQAAWRDAAFVIERLAAHQPRLRARPRSFLVQAGARLFLYDVRGTCCLYYRTIESPDRNGEGYCANCPLRSDESRAARLQALLDG